MRLDHLLSKEIRGYLNNKLVLYLVVRGSSLKILVNLVLFNFEDAEQNMGV